MNLQVSYDNGSPAVPMRETLASFTEHTINYTYCKRPKGQNCKCDTVLRVVVPLGRESGSLLPGA